MGAKACVLPLIAFICALEFFQNDLRPFSRSRCARPIDRRHGLSWMLFHVLLVFYDPSVVLALLARQLPLRWGAKQTRNLYQRRNSTENLPVWCKPTNSAVKQSASPYAGEAELTDIPLAGEGGWATT